MRRSRRRALEAGTRRPGNEFFPNWFSCGEKAGMDSLPKSRYGRFVPPGLLPHEALDIVAPDKFANYAG